MEVDTPKDIIEDEKGEKDKRTKWQLPPSHHNLFIGPPEVKSKFTKHHQQTSNMDELGNITDSRPPVCGNTDNMSLRDVANALSDSKISRVTTVARAEICPKIHRARIMGTKGIAAKISEQYGYEISNTTFLYAEEALYLLEIGKLEIFQGKMSLSIERARSLFLHSKSHPFMESNSSRMKTCSVDEYVVYKHLSELGYRVRRKDLHNIAQQASFPSPVGNPVNNIIEDTEMIVCDPNNDEGCAMDLDVDATNQLNLDPTARLLDKFSPANSSSSGLGNSTADSLIQKGIKRKFGELSSDLTQGSTTSSKDMSDDENEDADGEFEFIPTSTTSYMESGENSFPQPFSTSSYTVVEADSDVEITDDPLPSESCSNGVVIEEIGYGYDGDIEEERILTPEPQPSTSSACYSTQQSQTSFVDLVDSDSETNESLWTYSKLWSKFVPNATIQIGFPPSFLLPKNIPAREIIYEFESKSRESLRSDSDLEYYVDELTLSPTPAQNESKDRKIGSSCKTWKDWRQGTMNEVQGVLIESLLGKKTQSSKEDPMQKLHLWGQKAEPECKRRADGGWKEFNIPYELYHPTMMFNKTKFRKEVVPDYVVAIVRNDEIVPSFASCDPLINGIPALIALVSDESTIIFMNPDRSPIPSLF